MLSGRQRKQRASRGCGQPRSPTLSYWVTFCGKRGQALFTTLWASMLDAPIHELKELAVVASRQGWIEYRAAGDVVEVSFRHLMREQGVAAP